MTASRTSLGPGWCHQGVYDWHLEENTQEVCPWLQGLPKDEEVAKINKVLFQVVNNFHLGVDEHDIEELLKMVPEELTNKVLLELEWEFMTEEETR